MHYSSFQEVIRLILLIGVFWSTTLLAIEDPSILPEQAGIEEHLNQPVDLSLGFADSTGRKLTLQDLALPGRAMILVPVYYSCPQLCKLTLAGVARLVNELSLVSGSDYSLVTFSFDSGDTPATSTRKQQEMHSKVPDDKKAAGWHFLTGTEESIRVLTGQLGFKYRQDSGDFVHSTILAVITPDGRISRYFYGIDYPATEVKRALVEASEGRIGSTLDRVFMFCFRYDNIHGQYTPLIWNITRVVCSAIAVLVFAAIVMMRFREKRA